MSAFLSDLCVDFYTFLFTVELYALYKASLSHRTFVSTVSWKYKYSEFFSRRIFHEISVFDWSPKATAL